MRILGIDASLRSTGLGVIETAAGRLRAVEFGTVRNAQSVPHSQCLKRLYEELSALLLRAKPDAAALEGGFYFKNAKTALILGEVRGVAIAACAAAGVPVYEYSPRLVKQGLTGSGGATKQQVEKMVMAILGVTGKLQEDAADALAIAICHAHGQTGVAMLRPQPL